MKVNLKTGLGYIKRNGKIIEKFVLPTGEHIFPDDVEVVEVATREELDNIQVHHEPPQETIEQKLARLREEIIDRMLADEDVSLLKEQYKSLRQKLLSGG